MLQRGLSLVEILPDIEQRRIKHIRLCVYINMLKRKVNVEVLVIIKLDYSSTTNFVVINFE